MSFDGLPGRLRSLERALAPSGVVVVVIVPSDSAAARAEKERVAAEARARGRECVVVRIGLDANPTSVAGARPDSPEGLAKGGTVVYTTK